MPTSNVDCDGKCIIKIVLDIHGTKKDVDVLVDTGFTSGTGFGLKLPTNFAIHAKFTGTGRIRVADNREVICDMIPNAKIIQIENHTLDDEVTIPTLFMDGPKCIGMMFLQDCILHLDGPNKVATLCF